MVNILTGTAFDAPKRFNHREDEVALEFPSSVGLRRRALNALKAQNWKATKKSGPTARDYVQAGLLGMWDAIENVGWGQHDSSSRTWVDIVGRNNLSLVDSFVFGGASLVMTPPESGYATLSSATTWRTAEVVFRAQAPMGQCVISPNKNGDRWMIEYIGGRFDTGNNNNPNNIRVGAGYLPGSYAHVGFTKDSSGNTTAGFYNGAPANDGIYNDWYGQGSQNFGGTRANNRYFRGEFFAVRMYTRELSPAEIAANYEVDKVRFGLT